MRQETNPSGQQLASDSALSAISKRYTQNVGNTERAVTGAAGGALALWGLRRGGLLGVLSLFAGAGLAARAASGYCPAYARMEPTEAEREAAERYGWKTAAVADERVTVARPREEVYRFWRDFSNLPRFMSHVERLTILSNDRSHWVARGPMGRNVEWDSIVTEEKPNERIAWRSAEGADVRNAGFVEFRDAATGGTEIRAYIAYEPPAGQLGRLIAKLWGEEPSVQARDDLQRLKQLLESEQIATTPAAATRPAGQRPSPMSP